MINRREFLQRVENAALISTTALIPARWGFAAESAKALDIGVGPQLFLDDYLVEKLDGLKRVVQTPERLPQPILDSKTFATTTPYMTVLRDSETNRFRMWYDTRWAIWHADSADGIHWENPRSLWQTSHCYGASIVDDAARTDDPKQRYKLAHWQATRILEDKPGDDGGVFVAFSPDGFSWNGYDQNPVLPTWPQGFGTFVPDAAQDIVDVFYDPLRKHYGMAVKTPAVAADGYAQGPKAALSIRRLVGMSTSKDFIHWEKPKRILVPDDMDEGLLEFYGMGGVHQRGGLSIGMVRVLRDDLPCDAGGPADGIGYTVLATSRDGETWNRLREPLLDRNPEPGSWDHAMTWIGYAMPVGDELFLYYGGYARGHKIAPESERQTGLARIKRDRYVALKPGRDEGKLVTRPFVVPAGRLTINADATNGEVTVRLLDEQGKPVETLGDAAAKPIHGDALAQEVRWEKDLLAMRGKPARLEFGLRNAAFFGFEFLDGTG